MFVVIVKFNKRTDYLGPYKSYKEAYAAGHSYLNRVIKPTFEDLDNIKVEINEMMDW